MRNWVRKPLWIRGNPLEEIGFHRPWTWFILGGRGEGKSSLLETFGKEYLAGGHVVLDLFGSRDGEGLAWLRSPHIEDKKALLIHGDNVSLDSSWEAKNISKVKLDDFERYDLVISSSPLYSSIDDEFTHVNRLINLLYKRMNWKRIIYTVIREAANLYYSRLKISKNQMDAKAESTYLIREARHMGISMGLDTLKYTSIDIDVRSVLDYLILKAQGVLGLPDDLRWLYHFIPPDRLRNLGKPWYYIISRTGSIGLGWFPRVKWHKREKENILKALGLKVEYGDRIDYGEDKGAFKTVSDHEHLEIIELYTEGVSMGALAERFKRSRSTIHGQIHSHNLQIDRRGKCARCERVKGEKALEKIII